MISVWLFLGVFSRESQSVGLFAIFNGLSGDASSMGDGNLFFPVYT